MQLGIKLVRELNRFYWIDHKPHGQLLVPAHCSHRGR